MKKRATFPRIEGDGEVEDEVVNWTGMCLVCSLSLHGGLIGRIGKIEKWVATQSRT